MNIVKTQKTNNGAMNFVCRTDSNKRFAWRVKNVYLFSPIYQRNGRDYIHVELNEKEHSNILYTFEHMKDKIIKYMVRRRGRKETTELVEGRFIEDNLLVENNYKFELEDDCQFVKKGNRGRLYHDDPDNLKEGENADLIVSYIGFYVNNTNKRYKNVYLITQIKRHTTFDIDPDELTQNMNYIANDDI